MASVATDGRGVVRARAGALSLVGVAVLLGSSPLAPTAIGAQQVGGSAFQLSPTIGAAAGLAFPIRELGTRVDAGHTVSVALGLESPRPSIGFRFEAAFDEFAWRPPSDLKRRVVAGAANILLPVSFEHGSRERIYLIGGVGMAGAYDTDATGERTTATTGLAANMGAGYRVVRAGIEAHVEVRYHNVSGNPSQQIVPITFGVSF